ncbi:MAG: hypothetical protein WC390_10830 [Sulfurimonas sp.]|jgi:hypothetical protein
MSSLFSASYDFFYPRSTNDIRFSIREYHFGYVAISNSFLVGAQSVLVDDVAQLETALSFFLDADGQVIELFDSRFPRTYGDEAKLRANGAYPFDYSELEAFIDLRKTVKHHFPVSYSYKCVKLDFESVTSQNESVTSQNESVTSQSVTSQNESVTSQSVTFQSVTSQNESVTSQSVTFEILCPCGCGNSLFGRKKYFNATCRKRIERAKRK